MEPYKENVIEWIRDESQASLTLTQGRFKSRIEKLAVERPEECEILARNKDGSIFAHVPISWIKISPPREVSEEQRRQAKERMEAMHVNGLLLKSSTGENR